MSFEDAIQQESVKNTQQIIDRTQQIIEQLQKIRWMLMQNSIAEVRGIPVPYPELTEEARRKELEKERNTYMYGYGVSFKDDREQKLLQEGKIIFLKYKMTMEVN